MFTVLVVDDVIAELELISIYLREGGYKVINATNAKEAWEKTLTQKPDVVVTDVVMPGMSGFELCRKLKKNRETQNLPVIVCTSKAQEIDRIWGMKIGVDIYITKPFSQEEIVRAVKSVVI
jgi:twitching motility two-component system response regulator PilH